MNDEVEVERDVCRQEEVEKIVGVERERVRVTGQRLPAAVVEVPVRNLAHAENACGDDLDRVVRREVVAEEEKTEDGQSDAGRNQGEGGAASSEPVDGARSPLAARCSLVEH